jgi:hypothetical protein
MSAKQQNGGCELNEISTLAVFGFKPIFFRQVKIENQEAPGELAEIRESNRPNQPVRIFNQTFNLSSI